MQMMKKSLMFFIFILKRLKRSRKLIRRLKKTKDLKKTAQFNKKNMVERKEDINDGKKVIIDTQQVTFWIVNRIELPSAMWREINDEINSFIIFTRWLNQPPLSTVTVIS